MRVDLIDVYRQRHGLPLPNGLAGLAALCAAKFLADFLQKLSSDVLGEDVALPGILPRIQNLGGQALLMVGQLVGLICRLELGKRSFEAGPQLNIGVYTSQEVFEGGLCASVTGLSLRSRCLGRRRLPRPATSREDRQECGGAYDPPGLKPMWLPFLTNCYCLMLSGYLLLPHCEELTVRQHRQRAKLRRPLSWLP